MRRIAVLAVLVLLVAACGEPSGSEAPSSTTSTTTATTPTATPTTGTAPTSSTTTTVVIGGSEFVIVPDQSGAIALDLMVGCPSGPTFPVSALDGVQPLVGSGHEDIEVAVAPFLESAEGDHWPQAEEWQVLHETDSEVILVYVDPPTIGFQTVSLVDGEWDWSGSSLGESCPLEARLPEGLNRVIWQIDPAFELDPESTTIHLLATERPCVSGQPMGDRFRAPHVVITETEVRVTLAADPPPGEAQTCPGNPVHPVAIDLGMPLGHRTVVDGLSVLGNLVDLLG